MTYTFATFTTRETYLLARGQWKHDYAALTKDIRDTKFQIKKAMREGAYPGNLQYYTRMKQKRTANDMLEALENAKVEAQRQYVASKEVCEA